MRARERVGETVVVDGLRITPLERVLVLDAGGSWLAAKTAVGVRVEHPGGVLVVRLEG